MIDIERSHLEIVAKYIENKYNDKRAEEFLKSFIVAFNLGWSEATAACAETVGGYWREMDSLHEGGVKSLLCEVEHAVRDTVL